MLWLNHTIHLALAIVALLGLWGLGRRLRRVWLPDIEPPLLEAVYDFAAGGLATWSILFLLGWAGLYRPIAARTLLAFSFLLAALELRRVWPTLRAWAGNAFKRSPLDWLFIATAIYVIVCAATGALTPPAAQDALVHHLNLPKKWIQAGAFIEYPYDYFSYFPAGMEMLYLYGMLIKGPETATLLHTGFGLATFAAIAAGCKLIGLGRTAGLVAATAYLTIPTVWMEMSWAYVDLALAFYTLLMALGLLLLRLETSLKNGALIAVAMAGALSIKYTGLYAAVPMPLLLFIACRERKLSVAETEKLIISIFALAGLLASPWYLKNLYWTHNPFFPFFLKLFPSVNPGWDSDRAALVLQVLSRYGGSEKTLLDYLITPWKLSFLATYGSDKYYQGVLGFFYFFGLLLLPATRKIREEARYLLVFAGTFYLFWLISAQEMRYLLPVFPVLAVAIASGRGLFEREGEEAAWRRWVRCAAIGLAIAAAGWNCWQIARHYREFRYLEVFTGRLSRQHYLRSRFDYYPFYEYANSRLPADSYIFLILASNQPFYLERNSFSDSVFEAYTIKRIVASSRSAADIRRQLQERGFTHLLYRPRLLFGESTTPFTESETRLFLEFMNSYCRIELIDPKQTFALLALTSS